MLQSQVNYWTLMENIRHNKATEEAGFQQAEASMISSKASEKQALIAEAMLPYEQLKAKQTERQADASLQQAKAALQNAQINAGNLEVNQGKLDVDRLNAEVNARNATVNERNAATNEYNARINQQNADTNVYNADINSRNADTNAWNAKTNERNASTREWEARIKEYEAVTNRMTGLSDIAMNESDIALNKYKQDEVATQAELNIAKSLESLANRELTEAKVPEQYQKNIQSEIDTQYKNLNANLDILNKATGSYQDIAGGTGTLLRGVGTTISNMKKNNTSSHPVWDFITNKNNPLLNANLNLLNNILGGTGQVGVNLGGIQ